MTDTEQRLMKNYEYLAEYYKNLKIISYDEVVDILLSSKDSIKVDFFNQYDALNDINYSCVKIWNNTKDTTEEYLSIDQDIKKVYENLLNSLKSKIKLEDLILQLVPTYIGYGLYCYIGEKNILEFPRKIVNEIYKYSTEKHNKETNDVVCIYRGFYEDKEIFVPNTLPTEEKEKVISKK